MTKTSKFFGFLISGLIFFIMVTPLAAQRYSGELHFSMGFPQQGFKDNIDRIALGGGISGTLKLGHTPLWLGLDMVFLNYGHNKRYETMDEIPEIELKVINSYNIWQSLLFIQFQPVSKGIIRPYIEALFGFNYLWTETSINDDDSSYDIARTVNLDDIALAYGGGCGFIINAGTIKTSHKKSIDLSLNFNARYIVGGKAEYMKKGSIVIDDGELTYLILKSKTDLLTCKIGVMIRF